jgi:hypothetical protein
MVQAALAGWLHPEEETIISIQLIQRYYADIERIKHYSGSRNESSLRKPFQDLLEQYARSKNFALVAEVELTTKKGTRIRPDGVRRPCGGVEISAGNIFRAGVDFGTIQREEAQRPNDCGEVQYI